jgi:MSHA pilin protein MshA
MKKQIQKGFTLIELVVVIVIIDILAAVAVPRFVNLSGEAGDASAQGAAGAMSSAVAMNFARFQVNPGASINIISGTTTCNALLPLLTGSAFPTNVQFVTGANTITCANPAGAGGVNNTSCMVNHTQGATAAGFAVTVICTS